MSASLPLNSRFKKLIKTIARGVAITVLNVCVMAPLMAALVTLLLMGPANFWGQFADSLPISMAVATIVNFFVVGPVVKLLYYNAISSTANGMRFLRFVQDNAMPWLLISNSDRDRKSVV